MLSNLKKCIFILLIVLFFISCTNEIDIVETTKQIDEILLESPDAMPELEKAVKENKIIFVGSGYHRQINDHNFLNRENIEKLRKLGVKYVLLECGSEGDSILSNDELEENWVKVFYPWHQVDVQYEENNIRKVVLDVNKKLNKKDEIIVVGLETGRENAIPETYSMTDFYNYRDEYMFKIAQQFIDNSKEDEKILIYAGDGHGYKKPVSYFDSKKWKPLGCYLNDKYGDEYAAYSYVCLSDKIMMWVTGSNNLPGQQIKEKFISADKAKSFNEIFNFLRKGTENLLDGYFIDKNTEYGVLHGYALSVPYIRKDVINQTVEIDQFCSSLGNKYDYGNQEQYYNLEELLRNVYYLKLYYGDLFDYNFWNPTTKLSTALNKLNQDYKGQKKINKNKIVEYQTYINGPMNDLAFTNSRKDAEINYEHWLPFIEKARAIYPEEVWCDYWTAIMNFKMDNYETALKYCDNFINNKLSMSCQVLPEILETAIKCCEETGKDENVYKEKLAGLTNEYKIDVSRISLYV